MAESVLHVENVTMQFGGVVAVNNLSMDIYEGEIVALIGPNGAGKTTAFNCITGVYEPTNGKVEFCGKTIVENHPQGKMKKLYAGDSKELYPHVGSHTPDYITKMGIARTFQNIRLFKSMTVFDNVLTAMHLRKTSNVFSATFRLNRKEEAAQREKTLELLKIVGLDDLKDELATSLPYGKQRRLEIARALATNPKVLLCDEATSALDPKTTRSILKLLREVNQRLGITIVVITHQMSVVKYICDRAAVMEKGRVVEEGTILEIFSHPKMPVTKGFIDTATNVDDLYELLEETRSGDGVNHGQTVYLLTYTGSSAGKPLMVELYQRFGVEANIIFGNVELLKGTPLGKLAVTLSGTPESVGDALEFIRSQNVVVEAL